MVKAKTGIKTLKLGSLLTKKHTNYTIYSTNKTANCVNIKTTNKAQIFQIIILLFCFIFITSVPILLINPYTLTLNVLLTPSKYELR
jgi:hypothetical protein